MEKAYVLGTSQGGFIAARMALLEPERVEGVVLAGTSLFSETNRKGSWTISAVSCCPSSRVSREGEADRKHGGQILDQWLPPVSSDTPTPDFVLPEAMSQGVVVSGIGNAATPETHKKWRAIHEKVRLTLCSPRPVEQLGARR